MVPVSTIEVTRVQEEYFALAEELFGVFDFRSILSKADRRKLSRAPSRTVIGWFRNIVNESFDEIGFNRTRLIELFENTARRASEFWSTGAPSGPLFRSPVCPRCNALLGRAGRAGLVLKATGERWYASHTVGWPRSAAADAMLQY